MDDLDPALVEVARAWLKGHVGYKADWPVVVEALVRLLAAQRPAPTPEIECPQCKAMIRLPQ